ncbi:hypothetical protein [Pseudoalteromonas obscura]|uniref:Uncharacterized protein n=1 Tax=Pseudoalteromonas obscura TaxID=3048491 RepID=A0ABT7ES92_9GAMM|nr:hypothetical protein [Pseudoalteromonas sp. P94(2023)]MDK2597919.1 hypothetical protein [Pseudoalteromonas sp. P94(2023)]
MCNSNNDVFAQCDLCTKDIRVGDKYLSLNLELSKVEDISTTQPLKVDPVNVWCIECCTPATVNAIKRQLVQYRNGAIDRVSYAYELGKKNFRAGYCLKDNLYPPGTRDFSHWYIGFKTAQMHKLLADEQVTEGAEHATAQ